MDKTRGEGPMRIGVIGAGGIARGVHLPSLNDMDDVEVVAICDILEDRARAMAEKYAIPNVYTLYKEMLEHEASELDAVFALVEPGNMFHVAWTCLEAGLDTFCEKPPGINLMQAETLARKAEEAGKILQVGFNRRHIPVVREALDIVRRSTTVTQVEGCFFKCGTGAFDHGSLSAFMSDTIHAVDLVRSMANGEPVAVASVQASHGEPVLNAWNGICRFDNGVMGIIKANYQTGGRVHRFEVHGPAVSAFINLGFGGADCEATILSHHGKAQYSLASRGTGDQGAIRLDGKQLAGSDEFYRYYGFYQEDRHFIDCLKARKEPETSIADAVKSMRLAEMLVAGRI
ncbi:MAG: Gfo/Idh/MocA family oxidoreductase [Kiritimatiellaeota bacterium]|nr:Gfo/Idh/MocA family oxidoreductase [Kiritimatiellota bacterium]